MEVDGIPRGRRSRRGNGAHRPAEELPQPLSRGASGAVLLCGKEPVWGPSVAFPGSCSESPDGDPWVAGGSVYVSRSETTLGRASFVFHP